MHSHKLQRSRNAGLDHRIHADPRIQCNNSSAVMYSNLDPCIHMHHAMPMFSPSVQPAHMTSLIAAQVQSANMLGLQHKHPHCKARLELLAHELMMQPERDGFQKVDMSESNPMVLSVKRSST